MIGLQLPPTAPFEQVHVAIDLETTGLDSARETIIEVGAVKFQGNRVLDTFQTLVNPGRPIPEFIQRLTGITPSQVNRAPFFNTVAGRLAEFIGSHPVVGHNIQFDLGFLASHGLRLNNTAYDTWDLASVFLPRTAQYSLGALARHFEVVHVGPHRALADAQATHGVFLGLLERAQALEGGLLAYIVGLAARSRWAIAPLLSGLQAPIFLAKGERLEPTVVGLTGLDLDTLVTRLGRPEKRRADGSLSSLDQDKIAELLGPRGAFARTFTGFEHRPEQEEMLAAVTRAIYESRHLIVEGGTGVGKSMAYLLP
ncbi:MAG: exonuclease domain-containing protein, partial [Chloroflexota bacterium]